MAAIYSNGGNRWNILDFNFTKRDALSSVYKISMVPITCYCLRGNFFQCHVFAAMKSVQNLKSFWRSSQNYFVLALLFSL